MTLNSSTNPGILGGGIVWVKWVIGTAIFDTIDERNIFISTIIYYNNLYPWCMLVAIYIYIHHHINTIIIYIHCYLYPFWKKTVVILRTAQTIRKKNAISPAPFAICTVTNRPGGNKNLQTLQVRFWRGTKTAPWERHWLALPRIGKKTLAKNPRVLINSDQLFCDRKHDRISPTGGLVRGIPENFRET